MRESRRAARPVKVGEVLARYLRAAGLAERVEQAKVLAAWPEVVGPEIARAATADTVTPDGTLLVQVKSSAWRQELSLMAPEILGLLNRGRKAGRIRRIRWVVGESGQRDRRPGGR